MGRHDRLADPLRDQHGNVLDKYKALEGDGLAGVGQKVHSGQIYINKQTPGNANDNSQNANASTTTSWKNAAMMYRGPVPSFIDKVMLSDTDNEQTIIKVLMRQTRRPELGDKFSSRHGQKGVCGLIVDQVDMPFSDRGVTPDICMNPHGRSMLFQALSPAETALCYRFPEPNDCR